MNENQTLNQPVQRNLRFSGDSIWPRLPESNRLDCQELIVQLLGKVLSGEREQERDNER